METVENLEVIVGTYEELTLGYRLVADSEEDKVYYIIDECEEWF